MKSILLIGCCLFLAAALSMGQHAGDSRARAVATNVNSTHVVVIFSPFDNNTIHCISVQNIGSNLICTWGGSSNDVANGYWLNPASSNTVGGTASVCIDNGFDNRQWWAIASNGTSRVQVIPEYTVNP